MADASPKTQINSPSDHANPTNFFLYKAALVTVFLVLLPLFPSLAPDFLNQTLHARSWELLQLIFVGIAVSYGLFSKKNDESHKDHPISKMDNAQSYVSKLLQVSSVFDDDSDTHTVFEESKFQALNSQYYRGQPVVVVAKENPAVEETNGVVSQINQKPLLLPVRSLKHSSSRAGSTKFSTSSKKSRDEEEEKEEENVVLRSPIPWRSRSGRMEMNEDGDDEMASFSMEDQELNRVESRSIFRSQSKKGGGGEDGVRKKSFAPPPPAPPPPPPPPPPPSSSAPPFLIRKPAVLKKSSSSIGSKPNAGSAEKVLRRSVRSVPSSEEELRVGVRNSDALMKSNDYEMRFVDKRGAVQSYTAEEEEEIREKAVVETMEEEESSSEETEEEDDRFDESSSGNVGSGAADVGPDVDKKADEFIAKFREQIRLQRIESIRRSTAQRAGKALR